MTIAQKYLFWREWNLAKKWLMERGTTPVEAEKKRVRLIIDALGYGKSMSEWPRWKNDELDKCLAKFRAIYDGGNLDAQLDAIDQPAKRAGKAEAILRNLVAEVYPHVAGEDTQYKWDNHIQAMARKVCKKSFAACNDAEIHRLIGIFQRQRSRKETEAAEAIAEAHARSDKIDLEEYLG